MEKAGGRSGGGGGFARESMMHWKWFWVLKLCFHRECGRTPKAPPLHFVNSSNHYFITMNIDLFTNGNKIAKSSASLYMRNVRYLSNPGWSPTDPDPLEFLSDITNIDCKLKKYKDSTKKSFYTAIVVALKNIPHKVPEGIVAEYHDRMMALSGTSNSKSESQKSNWVTLEEIDSVRNKYRDLVPSRTIATQKEYQNFQLYVMLSLYTDMPPRRNVDYQYCVVADVLPENSAELETNFYVKSTGEFVFYRYKTQRKYCKQTTILTDTMRSLIDRMIDERPLIYQLCSSEPNKYPSLFVDSCGVALYKRPQNTITRMLNRVFSSTGKKVGCSLLRNIYLTNKYEGVVKSLDEDVEAMGTSADVARSTYIKAD